ncbi:AraC family transcriptional regulator [Algiphilus aromaticivorans]|uniref:AraC family transcriptional regulator n=1 Tax=Algiphilus aromaticivorans TaxID=382454 RepID=UPI000693585C|nr:AraC family transcriptional regulator [Algiphilus aromaticivorans]
MSQDLPLRGAVPNSYVLLLYDYLAEQGLDATVLLGAPPPASHAESPTRFPVTRWKALLETAAARLGDPLLGLHLGERVTPAHFGLMGYVLLACENLAAALQRLREFERLFYDVSPLRVHAEDEQLILQWGTEAGRPGALADEAAVTALVTLARDITAAPTMAPISIDFVNPAPADRSPHEAILGCPVAFDSTSTRVRIPVQWLAMPLRHPDPQLLALLRAQAAEQLRRLPPRGEFGAAIRTLIPELLQQGRADAPTVAGRLHLSLRSLHRHLAAEGQSFRALRDECLYQLACDHLADQRLQLGEIAQLLSYSEQSAFTRAFRRWSGQSPRRFRQALQTRGHAQCSN